MPSSWANFGIDLHLELASQRSVDGRRVRVGLETALREAVRSGRLGPGTKLPPSRGLAADLGIARNTVAEAYAQLIAEGWLTARTGAGTWVADRPAVAPPPPQLPTLGFAPASAAVPDPVGAARFDLTAGVPSVAMFPRAQWLSAARAALQAAPDYVLGYPDPRGLPELRTALAGYLARARGVITNPDRIVICAGFAHGLAMIASALASRGATTIAVEGYGRLAHRQLITAHGLRAEPLPIDDLGARPAPSALDGASAVALTPAHQFPLGMTLAPQRRAAFTGWAAQTGGVLIEDDYDGEFRYDRQPTGALQALAPEHVIYAGTASKSLAPGLRLGWLAAPAALIDDLVAAKARFGAENGLPDQLALARLINSGGYDRQIRLARLAYRRRRDQLIAALSRQVPDVHLTGIAAGLHAVATLPATSNESAAIARAAAHGVAVDGLASYATTAHTTGPALVIGYSRPAAHAYTTAITRLCAALAESGRPG
jgi:GntR family transcriptional regulator/MocR family aminotransferase